MSDPTKGDHERFAHVQQPVYIRDNVYAPGATAYEAETRAAHLTGGDAAARVVEEGDGVYLETTLPTGFDDVRVTAVGTLTPLGVDEQESISLRDRSGTVAALSACMSASTPTIA